MTVIDERITHASFCYGHEPAEEGTEVYPCTGTVAEIGGTRTWASEAGVYLGGIPALGTVLTDAEAENLSIALMENVMARRASQIPAPRRPMDDEVGQ